jgi:Lipocalin-like domain
MHTPTQAFHCTTRSTQATYWEGVIEATGTAQGKPKRGQGYMELTGMPSRSCRNPILNGQPLHLASDHLPLPTANHQLNTNNCLPCRSDLLL